MNPTFPIRLSGTTSTVIRLFCVMSLSVVFSGCGGGSPPGGLFAAAQPGGACVSTDGTQTCGLAASLPVRLACQGGIWAQLEACVAPKVCVDTGSNQTTCTILSGDASGDTSGGDASSNDGDAAGDTSPTRTLLPIINVTVDGALAPKVFAFAADTTGGQLTFQAKVLILNSGDGKLSLNDIKFDTQNTFLKLVYPKGKPSFPTSLATNEHLQLQVRFTPDPNIENNEAATLTIKHNDLEKSDIVVQFTILKSGPRINLQATNHVFLNASTANPPKACFKFGNKGSAPLIFKSAQMESATKVYNVIDIPDTGTTIAPLGQGDNPKDNPKLLEVCVRLTPGDKSDNYDAKLVIETNDPTQKQAKITLSATWEVASTFKLTCATPDGSLKYDFSGVKSGIVKKCCNIYNEGPSALLISKIEVAALESSDQKVVNAIFGAKLYKTNSQTGEKIVVPAPFSISPSKSLDFCVEYIFPNDNKTTNGELVVHYSQANVGASLRLPVLAGTCETPDLLVGPGNSPLWMQAKLGDKAIKMVTVVNQSCAPLQILQVCTTQVGSTSGGSNPCKNTTLQSAHFGLNKEIGLTSVKAWETLPIAVTFEPPNEKYKTIHHFLNIVYCPGAWSGDKCAETVAMRTINLTGTVDADATKLVQVPTLTLAAFNDQKAVVGQPFKIEAVAKPGNAWPIGKYAAYLWVLAERPKNSALWISNDFQTTDVPSQTIVPDQKGTYSVIGQVQAVDQSNQSNLAWSEQVTFTFVVTQ